MSKLWRKLDDDTTFCSECGFDIKNNKSPTIKSSDNEILGNNGLVIGGLIAVAIFILAIGIFSLNSGDVTIGEASFNIPAGFEENMDLRKDNEQRLMVELYMLVFMWTVMEI